MDKRLADLEKIKTAQAKASKLLVVALDPTAGNEADNARRRLPIVLQAGGIDYRDVKITVDTDPYLEWELLEEKKRELRRPDPEVAELKARLQQAEAELELLRKAMPPRPRADAIPLAGPSLKLRRIHYAMLSVLDYFDRPMSVSQISSHLPDSRGRRRHPCDPRGSELGHANVTAIHHKEKQHNFLIITDFGRSLLKKWRETEHDRRPLIPLDP